MAVSNLCLSVFYENDIVGPYNFVYTGQTNGRNVWYSSGNSLTMLWNSGNTYWEVSNFGQVGSIALRNTSNVQIPINGWNILGVSPKNNVIVKSGSCGTYPPLVLKSKITNNTCPTNCDGIIVASAIGESTPYVYSLDSINFKKNPIFSNICEGQYSLSVSASTGAIVSSIVSVGTDFESMIYNVSLENISQESISNDVIQTTFRLNIVPELKVGDVLSLRLNSTNTIIKYEPGSSSGSNIMNVYKNTSGLTPTIAPTVTVSSNRPYCSPSQINSQYIDSIYTTTLMSGNTLTGITTSTINNILFETDSNGCSTKIEQKNIIKILSARINTCKCCKVIFDSENYAGINLHVR
jgi:hypothetical protein